MAQQESRRAENPMRSPQLPPSSLVLELLFIEAYIPHQEKFHMLKVKWQSRPTYSQLSGLQLGGCRGQYRNCTRRCRHRALLCCVVSLNHHITEEETQPEKEQHENGVVFLFVFFSLSLEIMQHIKSYREHIERESRSEATQKDHQ